MIRDPRKTEAYLQIIEQQGTLEGRFSNVRRVNPIGGGGAFSLICVAHDDQTGCEVALKFFDPDCRDLYRRDSFQRESRLLGEFRGSKDIIELVNGHAEFQYAPNPAIPLSFSFAFYALEKAERSLEDIIAGNLWTPSQHLLAMRTLTRAVQRIHSKQVAHRDLKPGNCLLTSSGLKLSDFGTARSMSETDLLMTYVGPPGDTRYVPPEMMACLHDVDPQFAFAGDFFALGAILFELFTGLNLGVRLFTPNLLTDLTLSMSAVPRDERVKIFNQIIGPIASRYPLPSIDSLNPNLPACIRPRLNQLFKELCAIDYRRRVSSFSQIFRGIDTCLLILNNEEKYLEWHREKQRRRVIRMQKSNGVSQ